MTPRQLRDVLAVLLMTAGLAGAVIVAFAIKPLAGFGLLAVIAFVAGVLLSYDRR